jgi:hypothetical protein
VALLPAAELDQSVALVPQGEPVDTIPSDKSIETEFRARLQAAGEALDAQYMPRTEVLPQA